MLIRDVGQPILAAGCLQVAGLAVKPPKVSAARDVPVRDRPPALVNTGFQRVEAVFQPAMRARNSRAEQSLPPSHASYPENR